MKLLTMSARRHVEAQCISSQEGISLWATEGNLARVAGSCEQGDPAVRTAPIYRVVLNPNVAFYRSYTEALLRRYGVLSMESGRVPSLLGREMFRGKVTNYRVHGFDDVVIFVHDVDRCLELLSLDQQKLIRRIGVQEYTFGEAAAMFGLSLRSVQRRYFDAVDELTSVFLKRRLLERLASDSCQEGNGALKLISHTP